MPIFRMDAKANGDLFPCAPLRHYDMALRLIDDLSFVLRIEGKEFVVRDGDAMRFNKIAVSRCS